MHLKLPNQLTENSDIEESDSDDITNVNDNEEISIPQDEFHIILPVEHTGCLLCNLPFMMGLKNHEIYKQYHLKVL